MLKNKLTRRAFIASAIASLFSGLFKPAQADSPAEAGATWGAGRAWGRSRWAGWRGWLPFVRK